MNLKWVLVLKRPAVFLSVLFCCLISVNSKATCCVSLYSSYWANGLWSCGIPACGDTLIIQSNHTVTINSQQDYSGCSTPMCVYVYGVLQFVNGNKLRLPCGSMIYVMAGGSIQPGSGGGNSNYIEICSNISWSAGNGPMYGPSCVGCAPLSMELVSFTGNIVDKKVELNWTTATEKDVHHFEVERSDNAIHFIPVSITESKSPQGNSSEKLNYLCFDNAPLAPGGYYRLKEVEKNGVAEYSKTIYVDTRRDNRELALYPNPNTGNFIIHLGKPEGNKLFDLSLRSADGTLVHELSFLSGEQELNEVEIALENKLKPGIYFLTLTINGEEIHSKILIQ